MSFFYINRDCDGKLSPLPASPYLLPAIVAGGILAGLGALLRKYGEENNKNPEFIRSELINHFGEELGNQYIKKWRECAKDYKYLRQLCYVTGMSPSQQHRWNYINYYVPWYHKQGWDGGIGDWYLVEGV